MVWRRGWGEVCELCSFFALFIFTDMIVKMRVVMYHLKRINFRCRYRVFSVGCSGIILITQYMQLYKNVLFSSVYTWNNLAVTRQSAFSLFCFTESL